MINAKTARTLTEIHSTYENDLAITIEPALEMIEKKIVEFAEMGCCGILVTKEEIKQVTKFGFFSHREIFEAVVKMLEKEEFTAYSTASFSSIHVEW